MPSIDERVVSMAFENAKFEAGVAQTMATLSKLDSSLQKIGQNNSLGDIEKAANKVTLEAPMSAMDKLRAKFGRGVDAKSISDIEREGDKVTLGGPARALDILQNKLSRGIDSRAISDLEKAGNQVTLDTPSRAIDNLAGKFTFLEHVAANALGGIAAQGAMRGASFAKSFAFGPLTQGMQEYQTNLGSIQTILANTQGQQVTGLGNVNKYLGELNTYSDQTIYNFSEMARNIGTFTAAGVDLPKSTEAIKGIANLAALSGSNSQQASTAMYQLSQAIAAGRVGLQDWNSVVNAGMGGAVFQKSLMRTAESMGALKDGAVEIDKATGKATINGQSFRESIMAKPGEQSWLTSEVLTNTLSQLTGDMTDAQLAAQGFSAEQIKAIQAQAKSAQEAATQVKTLPQVFDVARETIGSGWSKTFQLIFGNFNQSKTTFTDLSNAINGVINRMSDARNKILSDWSALGGRTELIDGIKAAFAALSSILEPIGRAFHNVFGTMSGGDLEGLTAQFKELMESLQPSQATIDNLQRIFSGLFAVLHIGWSVVKGVAGVIGDLLGVVGRGSGGVLSFAGSIGDFLVAIDKVLTQGGGLEAFFDGLGSVLQRPVSLIKSLVTALAALFSPSAGSLQQRNAELEEFGRVLTPAERLVNKLRDAWASLVDWFRSAKAALEPWFSTFVDRLSGIGDILADAFKNVSFDDALSVLQTGFVGGIFLMLKNALGGGGVVGSIVGVLDSVKDVLGGVTGNLEAMQKNLQANTLLAIGAAIAVLAGGIFILSKIDGNDLAKAMTATAVGLGELMGAMKLMTSGMGRLGVLQMPIIAASLIGLATATTILAAAMKIFATMSWEDIAQGLVGVAGSIAAVGASTRLLGPGLLVQGPALIAIAAALNLMAVAVKQFSDMSWVEMGRGLLGVSMSLLAIGAATTLMGPSLALVGPGLIAVAFAMTMLSSAITTFGNMDPAQLVQGILGMAGALVALGAAIMMIPPTAALQGAGLIVVATGLIVLGGALATIGNLDTGTLVKGIVGMAGALVVLAGGLILMTGTLPGSLALLAAAGAFAVLGPAMAVIGNLDWGTILKALGAMVLTMGALAAVGAVVSVPLTTLGIALGALGLAMLTIVGSVYIFAKAISLLSESGQKGFTILLTAITAFVAMLPKIVIDFLKGIASILETLVTLAPRIVTALGQILDTIIQFVVDKTPDLVVAVTSLLGGFLVVVTTMAPKIVSAGLTILTTFLSGIERNIGRIVTTAASIIIKFLDSLRAQAPKLINSGANLLVSFISGITSKIPLIVTKVAEMITKYLSAVSSHLPKIIAKGAELITKFINGVASQIGKVISAGVNFITKFLGGIASAIPKIVNKGIDVAEAFLKAVAKGAVRLVNIGFNAVIDFLNGTAKAIRERGPELRQAGWNVADAIIDGLIGGLGELWSKVTDTASRLASKLPGAFKKVLGISSPSSVFAELGRNTLQGMALGMAGEQGSMIRSAENVSNGVIGAFKDIFEIGSPSEVLKEVGKEVGRGFRDGLDGSASDIRGSFQSIRDKLSTEMQTTRDNIKTERQNLKDLLAADDPDIQAIRASVNTLNTHNRTLTALRNANQVVTKNLRDEKQELIGLSNDYDKVSAKLDSAKQTLDDAIRTRDDAAKSYAEKYSETPDISGLMDEAMADADLTAEQRRDKQREAEKEREKRSQIDQVANYKQALAERITATQQYKATLDKLRAAGLDDETYQKLLDEGTAGQEFADQLLAAGPEAIGQINKLDAQLMKSSTDIAKKASTDLYQAGVDAATGLVNGLEAEQSKIRSSMEKLAREMVRAIKKELKIKSPSAVFGQVGRFSGDGLARGLNASSRAVGNAAAGVGLTAAEGMMSSLASVGDRVGSEIDTDVTITPVLDLSQVKKDAGDIPDSIGTVTPITAAVSYGRARTISGEKAATDEKTLASQGISAPIFNYEQNNYSPESLSDVEIYRRTRNQLSQVKSALGIETPGIGRRVGSGGGGFSV